MDATQLGGLEGWLAGRLGSPVSISDATPLSTGFSAETILLETSAGKLVLRRESPDPAVYPQQAPGFETEVDIQFRVMTALAAGTGIPLAPLIGYEAAPAVLGAPFFIMEFIDGVVPRVSPSYASEGFFHAASPAERRTMIDHGLEVLAELHTLDWAGHDLGWLLPGGEEPTVLRQHRIWRDYLRRELDGRQLPLVTDAFDWLAANAPAHDPASVVLNWGDPRPGNMIWRDFGCVCVTDFEASSIAPPELDLGWWLMFDRWSHEQSDATRLEGEPTREQQAAGYFERSGRAPIDTHWYEVFAAARYCAIVVRVMNRTVARGLMPADNDFWRENQSTACLEELLS